MTKSEKARLFMPNAAKRLQSLLTQELRTSKTLWGTISAALFVWLGAVDMHFGKEPPYWDMWGIFLNGKYISDTSEMVFGLSLWTFLLGLPSIVVGWVVQAFVVVGAAIAREARPPA